MTAAEGSLPVAAIGRPPGAGRVLGIGEQGAWLDGEPLGGADAVGRTQALEVRAGTLGGAGAVPLYLAAHPDVDVRTIRRFVEVIPAEVPLRLLIAAPPAPAGGSGTQGVAAPIFAERDPSRRRRLSEDAFSRAAPGTPVAEAVRSVTATDPGARWPALRAALLTAVERADCARLDTGALGELASAEQRAGAGALTWVPASFLRDARCGASMPLRSTRKLVRQIEAFDAEFAGRFTGDAVSFDDVLVDPRLGVAFCDALPGETLAARARAREPLHVRRASGGCAEVTFASIAPGSPLGSLRVAGSALSFHYALVAEELRVFGPVAGDPPSHPSDPGPFRCDETLALTGIEGRGLRLGPHAAEFRRTDCEGSPPPPEPGEGCLSAALGGRLPRERVPASPPDGGAPPR